MRTLTLLMAIFIAPVYAAGSAQIGPQQGLVPQSKQSYVDTKNCTQPIRSSPYVIVAGNGGANMRLACPEDKPVMYSWRQQVGFAGLASVQVGGGASWITCCAIGHKWEPASVAL